MRVGRERPLSLSGATCLNLCTGELADLGTATLDQNTQHNGEQHAGCNANETNAIHSDSSLVLTTVESSRGA